MKRILYMVMSGITIVILLGVNNNYQLKTEENENIYPVVKFKEEQGILPYKEEKLEIILEKDYLKIEAEVTAYTAGVQCTGKTPDHPAYGITYSGYRVMEGVTIAAPQEFPLYTEIEIPGYGRGIVHDRGGAVRYRDDTQRYVFDVYIEDLSRALSWGRRVLEVKIYIEDLTDYEIQEITANLE